MLRPRPSNDIDPAAQAQNLEAMTGDGATVEPSATQGDDEFLFVTNDPEIARKYGTIEESEFWIEDESDST